MRKRLGILSVALLTLLCSQGFAAPNVLTEEDRAGGWKLLFDGKTTNGWRALKSAAFPEKGWVIEDGWLHCEGKKGGDIISEEQYESFELEWEWKLEPAGNSGVKYFIVTKRGSIGHEYQMLDDDKHPDSKLGQGKRVTGSLYDVLQPEVKTPLNKPGEINKSRILVKENHVDHWLNGIKVLEYECGSEVLKRAVQNSKFKDAPQFGERLKGHLLLQDHDNRVWFRNIKIRSPR